MVKRLLAVIGGAAVIAAAVMLLRPASTSPGSLTPWGEPDLQGLWTYEEEIPLQRPARFGNREFLTDEERAAIDKERAEILGKSAQVSDRRYERGTEQDVGGAYNAAVFTTHRPLGRRTSLIVDPPDGQIPPLTPEAQKKRAEIRAFQVALLQATDVCRSNMPGCAGGKYGPPSPRRAEAPPHYLTVVGAGGPGGGGGVVNRANGPEDRNLGERCMGAILPDFGGNTGFLLQIVQSPGSVAMFYDTAQGQGWQRIIPIRDGPHAPAHVRQWWGNSRGRWEGNTLVVDVANFTPKTYFQGSYENLHLTERWTRLDATTIEYAVTIEDPDVWTRPWTVKQEYKKQDDFQNRIYKEPRCHEGNYGMTALLAGARAEERAFAEGRGPDPATKCNAGCGGFAFGFADAGEESNPLAR
ncbi:MAG: hypothetical protein HYY76_07065 [Acidobacteria bacterium]|nr:hypothetical protein [Acidobacteriota bacterium]